MIHSRRWFALCTASLAIATGCTGTPPPEDVMGIDFGVQCNPRCADARDRSVDTAAESGDDVASDDATDAEVLDADDATAMDAATEDAVDAGDDTVTAPDIVDTFSDGHADVPVAPGPCLAVGGAVHVITETRALSRPVYILPEATSFAVGTHTQMSGIDDAYFFRIGSDSSLVGNWNVSEESGADVQGGAIAGEATNGYVMAFSSTRTGNFEVYARGITPGGPPSASFARITNDTQFSGNAQIVTQAGGYLVAWRSEDLGTGAKTILAAPITNPGFVVGTPVAVTPSSTVAGEFRLASNGTNAAIAYLAFSGAAFDGFAVSLGPTGTPVGTPAQFATSLPITGSVGAVLRGTDLAVMWASYEFASIAHAVHIDVATGALSPRVDLPSIGFNIDSVSLAPDGSADYVAGFRVDNGSSSSSAAMVRLQSDLHLRDGVDIVGGATRRGSPVNVASLGNGTYGVAWADDTVAGTTSGQVQLMACPP